MSAMAQWDDSALWGMILELQRYWPRTAGAPPLQDYVDLLAADFAALGLEVSTEPYRVAHWHPSDWSLTITSGSPVSELDVSACYPNSGTTPVDGVTGELVHLGHVQDARCPADLVKDRIVVVDYPFEPVELHYPHVWGVAGTTMEDLPSHWGFGSQYWIPLEELRDAAARAGARGLVASWQGVTEHSIRNQYQPNLPASVRRWYAGHDNEARPLETWAELPALWVGPAAGARLRAAMKEGASATLRLLADVNPQATTDTIIATLPGASDETIVLATHSDGVNAVQENGLVALRALAHHYARMPLAARPRTLTFVAVAPHLAPLVFDVTTGEPTVGESEGVLLRHPDLAERAVAAISIEHLGATEWVDDGVAYAPTGRYELVHVLTSSRTLAEIMLQVINAAESGPACVAEGTLWGVAEPFAERGVATVSYGAAPVYLFAASEGGEVEKLSSERFHAELRAIQMAVDMLMNETPRKSLRP